MAFCAAVLMMTLVSGAAGASLRSSNVSGVPCDKPTVAAMVETPVMVMEEVPVMVVIGDDSEEGVRDEPSAGPAGPQDISESCQKELYDLQANQTRVRRAEACEQNSTYIRDTFEALQHADSKAAMEAAAGSFHKCGNVSEACSKEVAPQVVLKLRLSGATISESCAKTAGNVSSSNSKEAHACQENATVSMVKGLKAEDLEVALTAAQHGLATCFKVEHPCDFQLAPLLLMQLLQSIQTQQQQQIVEVLLTGLRAKQQQVEAQAALLKTKAANVTKAAAKKAVSLLSIDRRVHITFGHRA